MSKSLSLQINKKDFGENFIFFVYTIKPKIIKSLLGWDKYLSCLEKKVKPDCIFTIFGPAYWKAKSKHVMGFADGWCYYPDSIAFKNLTLYSHVRLYVLILIKKLRVKNEADLLIVETNDAKVRITRYFNFPKSRIRIVNNTYNNIFRISKPPPFNIKNKLKNKFRLLTISAYYKHKNLEIIKEIIPYLMDRKIPAHFYLTINEFDYELIFSGYSEFITNIGPVDIKYTPSIYRQCDALFLPTLLETFTASYPEAMKTGKPILTSDLSFAREICGNAAEYFDPLDAMDIGNKIERIVNDSDRRLTLIKNGYRQLEKFDTPTSRAASYIDICNKLLV